MRLFDAIAWSRDGAIRQFAEDECVPKSRVTCRTMAAGVNGPYALNDFDLLPFPRKDEFKVRVCTVRR